MLEGAETITSPNVTFSSPELTNPFQNATPLGPEYFRTTTPTSNEGASTGTLSQEHSRATITPSVEGKTAVTETSLPKATNPQEEALMKAITEAAGGDQKIMDAMKQASAAGAIETPVASRNPLNMEPKSLLGKIGKGAYKVIVFIAKLLGVKTADY